MGAKKESVLCAFYNLPSGTPGEYGTGQRIVLDKKALFQFLTECQDVSQEIYDKWWSYQYPAELHADWQYVVSIVNTYLEKHGINAWDFEWLADRYLLTQNVLTSKLISEAHLLSRTISEKTYIYRVQKTFQTKRANKNS